MKSYIWLTDIHLNFLSDKKCLEFFISLAQEKADGIFITGDISNSQSIIKHLSLMQKIVNIPIYFILGNHDFYRSTFSEIENKVISLSSKEPNICYLSTYKAISLSSDIALVGHDGWVDSSPGDPNIPLVFMGDWYFIDDFRLASSNKQRIAIMQDRAFQAAEKLSIKLKLALENHSTVYLLTHFPPWLYDYPGLINKFWKSYHHSKIIGQYLFNTMADFPDKKLIVLSGHTHLKAYQKISDNIELQIGQARLKRPSISNIIVI